MYLHALSTALPAHAYSQSDCWEILRQGPALGRLKERSQGILQKVLLGDNGIKKRHFAVENIAGVFSYSVDELEDEFSRHAPDLAVRALVSSLSEAGWSPGELDAVLICTCTGYLCPGLTSFVAEKLGLRTNAFLQDLVGLGCGAAIPSLRAAEAICARDPAAKVAVVAVEICSAAFFLNDDPGVLISACLFADGAAASLWSGQGRDGQWQAGQFDTILVPEHRELLRFVRENGFLKNKLHRSVPEKASEAVERLWSNRPGGNEATVIAHPGGRDVLQAIRGNFPDWALAASAEVLAECGNMSSPSVLFALQRHLQKNPSPEEKSLWLTSFGAGFSAHSVHLTRGGSGGN